METLCKAATETITRQTFLEQLHQLYPRQLRTFQVVPAYLNALKFQILYAYALHKQDAYSGSKAGKPIRFQS